MKKNSDIHLKINSEQKELLRQRAAQTGLSLSSYCIFVLLNTKPRIVQERTKIYPSHL